MAKITVLDSICGSGKTSLIVEKMNKENRRWLYICPYISEVERIIASCPKRKFKQPKAYQKNSQRMNKSDNLYELIEAGENIASTHELFKEIDSDMANELRQKGYTLVMDEVMEIIKPLPFSQSQVQEEKFRIIER